MHTKKFDNTFSQILELYGLNETIIIYSSNLALWAKKNGVNEINSGRIAMALRRKDSQVIDIVLKETIEEKDIPCITSGMWYRGFEHYNELKNLKKFIIHTFLHEVAHCLGKKDELEADNWAWSELSKIKGNY